MTLCFLQYIMIFMIIGQIQLKSCFFFQIEQQMDALHKQKAAQYKKTAEVSLLLRPKHTQELCTVCILPCIMAVAIIGG